MKKKYISPISRVADLEPAALIADSSSYETMSVGKDITEGQTVQGDARDYSTHSSLWDQEW